MPHTRQNREELLEDIYYLQKQLEKDKSDLAGPWADAFSFTALPVLLYFGINKTGLINYLSEYYQTYYRQEIQNFFDKRFAPKIVFRNDAVVTVKKFEEQMIDIAKQLIEGDPALKKHLGIKNIQDETTWPFPCRLDVLPNNDKHLLFQLAHYIDGYIETHSDGSHLRSGFIQALNNVINAGFNWQYSAEFSAELVEKIPELANKKMTGATFNVYSDEINTHRAAVILKEMYPDMANFDLLHQKNIDDESAKLAKQHLQYLEYFAALVTALLAKGLLINPLFKKYFPINWYLTTPIKTKLNYSLMDMKSLQEEKETLERAHQELLPYVDRNKKITNAINLLLIAYAIYLFMEGVPEGGFYFLKLAYTPLLLGVVGEKALIKTREWKDQRNVEQRISTLTQQLQYIFGDATQSITFSSILYDRLSLSSLKITIKKGYQGLSKRKFCDVVTHTLNRFGIQFLPSYTLAEFSISAQTTIQTIALVKNFFANLVVSATQMELLAKQIKVLFKVLNVAYEKNINIDKQDLYEAEYIIKLPEYLTSIKNILTQYGFVEKNNYLVLNKNSNFSEEIFISLISKIKQANAQHDQFRGMGIESSEDSNVITQRKSKKTKQENGKEEQDDKQNVDQTVNNKVWLCGATYPGNVMKVRGTINKYMFWTLKEEDFGEYKNSFVPFKNKSEQMASKAMKKAGVKHRPTLALDNKKPTQDGTKTRLFPAHIKIPGNEHGNEGVLLEVQKNAEGDELYITHSFSPNIHKGIK